MVGIKVKAITDKGTKALEQHLAEVKKMGLRERMAAATLLTHAQTNNEPLEITITIKSRVFLSSLMRSGMDPRAVLKNLSTKALADNGAVLSTDYSIEEVE